MASLRSRRSVIRKPTILTWTSQNHADLTQSRQDAKRKNLVPAAALRELSLGKAIFLLILQENHSGLVLVEMVDKKPLVSIAVSVDHQYTQQCLIDSLPVPVMEFHLVPGAAGDWAAYGADFGKVASKQQTIFGYKLHLLITLSGVILDFELAPASATDLTIGAELLVEHTDLTVLGDKGYVSDPLAEDLWQQNRLRLIALRRKNQKHQLPPFTKKLINQVRQLIETVNGQLTDQFNVEKNRAHSFYGLCARLYTKLTAHTLSVYLNRLVGNPNVLQIKSLAFPNI